MVDVAGLKHTSSQSRQETLSIGDQLYSLAFGMATHNFSPIIIVAEEMGIDKFSQIPKKIEHSSSIEPFEIVKQVENPPSLMIDGTGIL